MDVSVDAATRLVALLGDPVEHSLSPDIHNSAFVAKKLNFVYVALKVSALHVEEAVQGLRALNFAGANVTAPHKQAVIPALDRLSSQAAEVGAVNTIVCKPRPETGEIELFGDNTDIAGFLGPLQSFADRLRGKPMVVFGAGGAARAVVYALLTTFQPERLTLAARTPERAHALAEEMAVFDTSNALAVRPIGDSREAVRSSVLIVNATTLGTHPRVETSPWPHLSDFSREQFVYDLVYNPGSTRLLRDAASRGATILGGLEMLIAQAALAFEQWTGHEMPSDAVRKALRS
ncbi:MAG: shikimate dehydrogenase [Rhodothermales bacterium]